MSFLLFADDNEAMRRMVRDVLEASGHEVAVVPDGTAALAAIRQREPDLLILDYSMPGMSGFEVCRSVKSNPFTSRVPVLMLTADSEIERKVEGFEAGADDYLAKPFDPRELRARVTALMRLVRREADRNPTSGFPGGRAIEDAISRRVQQGGSFAVAYFDIDNFKPFADAFGFAAADDVIRGTALAIKEAVDLRGDAGDFVGHIGGDDFLAVTSTAHARTVATEASRRFREVIRGVLGDTIMERGVFSGLDRSGELREFPLAAISTAVITLRPGQWLSINHLGERAAEVKRRAKQQGAGTILVESV